jgi:hypothetical protein
MRGNDYILYSVCAQLSLAHNEYARNYFLFKLSMHGMMFILYGVCAELYLAYTQYAQKFF